MASSILNFWREKIFLMRPWSHSSAQCHMIHAWKILKHLSAKLRAKFPDYTWLLHGKNGHLVGAFSEFFELETSPVEGQTKSLKTSVSFSKSQNLIWFLCMPEQTGKGRQWNAFQVVGWMLSLVTTMGPVEVHLLGYYTVVFLSCNSVRVDADVNNSFETEDVFQEEIIFTSRKELDM